MNGQKWRPECLISRLLSTSYSKSSGNLKRTFRHSMQILKIPFAHVGRNKNEWCRNTLCENKATRVHKQKQRRFFFPQETESFCQSVSPFGFVYRFSKFSPVSVHSRKIAQTGHVQSAKHTHANIHAYTHATCYMPHKWGPADRLESRLAGASSVSLRESWWEWRQCPPPPTTPTIRVVLLQDPRWSPKEPGPKLPVLNLPAPRPPPAGWSRETPHWNKQISSFQTCPFTLTVSSHKGDRKSFIFNDNSSFERTKYILTSQNIIQLADWDFTDKMAL